MKPSQYHNNRKPYNWLIYDIGDKFLEKYSKFYKGRLVDLGCGEAPYKEFFLQYVKEYIGVDWTNSQHKISADVISNLNEKILLPNEFADTIIALFVLEHLSEPEIFLRESFRILKRGGFMFIGVPFQWWIHEQPYDFFRYTPYGLYYLMKKVGFHVLSIEPYSGFFTTLILKFNYFTLRFIRGPKIIQSFIKKLLYPVWYIGQKLAPVLDRLDKDWYLEAAGFYVLAMKK
ncbi:MAG: class I SAM-dependent methyltransferase [Candidatus Kapaibacteriota bacterium]